jgi:hypothetical protein
MTIETILNSSITEAIVYLKNGKRKYGMLIDSPVKEEYYQFISNDNLAVYQETYSANLIEFLPHNSVEAIDKNLK